MIECFGKCYISKENIFCYHYYQFQKNTLTFSSGLWEAAFLKKETLSTAIENKLKKLEVGFQNKPLKINMSF